MEDVVITNIYDMIVGCVLSFFFLSLVVLVVSIYEKRILFNEFFVNTLISILTLILGGLLMAFSINSDLKKKDLDNNIIQFNNTRKNV